MGTCLFCSLLHSQLLGNYLLHSMSELAWTHESCKLQCCKHISCKVVKAFQKNPQSWYLRIKAEWVGDKLCFSFYPNVCAELLSCVWLFVAHGWWPARFLCPWNFPCKNTGVGGHLLLQEIFLIQGSNPNLQCLLCGRQILYHWATWETSKKGGIGI